MDRFRHRRRSPRRSPRRNRSRSPGNLAAISKALAGFGRYQNSRPVGLMVNKDGGFMLDNLMDCWGHAQGYARREVLEAARKHMFHEDEPDRLRFEITKCGGDTMIKVRPRRGRGGPQQTFRAERSQLRHGGVKVEDSDEDSLPEDSLPPTRSARSVEEKLDMPLDALVSERQGDLSAASSSREPFAHREARVHRKMEQMGHTQATAHQRRPPVKDRPGSARSPPAPPLPRVKKPPVPMKAAAPPVKAPPVKPKMDDPAPTDKVIRRKEEPEAMELDDLSDEGFDEEDETPDPPPGEGWSEYEDNGQSWFYYDGPKGKWACLGPGHEVTRITDQ